MNITKELEIKTDLVDSILTDFKSNLIDFSKIINLI